MATAVSQPVTPALHSPALERLAPAAAGSPARGGRLLARILDAGILVVGVWSIPFVIIAMGTPIALAILGVLQLVKLLQNAF
jgi:hypothetical protein